MVTARPRRASGEGAVYDMYPWNQPADPRDQAPPPRYLAGPAAGHAAQATRAVQVALDRRDHGGDSPGFPPQQGTPKASSPIKIAVIRGGGLRPRAGGAGAHRGPPPGDDGIAPNNES